MIHIVDLHAKSAEGSLQPGTLKLDTDTRALYVRRRLGLAGEPTTPLGELKVPAAQEKHLITCAGLATRRKRPQSDHQVDIGAQQDISASFPRLCCLSNTLLGLVQENEPHNDIAFGEGRTIHRLLPKRSLGGPSQSIGALDLLELRHRVPVASLANSHRHRFTAKESSPAGASGLILQLSDSPPPGAADKPLTEAGRSNLHVLKGNNNQIRIGSSSGSYSEKSPRPNKPYSEAMFNLWVTSRDHDILKCVLGAIRSSGPSQSRNDITATCHQTHANLSGGFLNNHLGYLGQIGHHWNAGEPLYKMVVLHWRGKQH
ncbi:hypothetical protein C8F01DRAFT_1231232 [Mycena amicta]|nr:hypothetical protein C8F01DRAFT_1231232 [Mycena amicta]